MSRNCFSPASLFLFLILCLSLSLSGWHKALWCCIFFSSLEQITTPTEVETLGITRKNHFKNESDIPLERGDKMARRQPAIFYKNTRCWSMRSTFIQERWLEHD